MHKIPKWQRSRAKAAEIQISGMIQVPTMIKDDAIY